MQPDGKIAGAVAQDGVIGQGGAQGLDDFSHVNRAMGGGGRGPRFEIGARCIKPCPPTAAVYGGHLGGGGGKGRQVGVDGERRGVDLAQLLGSGVDMDKRRAGMGRRPQGIAASHRFAQPRPHRDHQIGIAQALKQFRVHPQPNIADVVGMVVIKKILAAEGGGHRQMVGLGKARQIGDALIRPTRPADHDERAFSRAQAGVQISHGGGRRRAGDPRRLGGVGDRRLIAQHVLGQRQHHRTRPAAHRRGVGAGDVFGYPFGAVDLGHPLGQRAEHGAVIYFLERFTVAVAARYLADKEDHRRRILARGMDTDGGVGRPRPPGDKTQPRPAGELAIGLGHVGRAAFLAAGHQAQAIGHIVKGIQHRQIALARYAERQIGPLGQQLAHQKGAAGQRGVWSGDRARVNHGNRSPICCGRYIIGEECAYRKQKIK